MGLARCQYLIIDMISDGYEDYKKTAEGNVMRKTETKKDIVTYSYITVHEDGKISNGFICWAKEFTKDD